MEGPLEREILDIFGGPRTIRRYFPLLVVDELFTTSTKKVQRTMDKLEDVRQLILFLIFPKIWSVYDVYFWYIFFYDIYSRFLNPFCFVQRAESDDIVFMVFAPRSLVSLKSIKVSDPSGSSSTIDHSRRSIFRGRPTQKCTTCLVPSRGWEIKIFP